MGRGNPIQSWWGGDPSQVCVGGTPGTSHHPDLAQGGTPGTPSHHPDLGWGTPHPDLGWGTPPPRCGTGYPPPRPGMRYPQTLDGVPPTQTWNGVPPTPRPRMGYPPPEMLTDTCENSTSPRTSDAGGKYWHALPSNYEQV